MKDEEPPPEPSAAMQAIRAWRSEERKKAVESIDRLIAQAEKRATSYYTRAVERVKWIRLAGQLLWYKDQIMRGMTWEALDQDVDQVLGDHYKEEEQQRRRLIRSLAPPSSPVIKKDTGKENKDSGDSDSPYKE